MIFAADKFFLCAPFLLLLTLIGSDRTAIVFARFVRIMSFLQSLANAIINCLIKQATSQPASSAVIPMPNA
jgi:hypothetical protein